MRVKTFYRLLKTISVVVLFFFMWTFGPMWQAVAYAATPQGQGAAKLRNADFGMRNEKQRPEERFEKALESIRENIGKAEEKNLKGQDITTEVAEVKKKRAEIEALDVELKKEFAATEKKLKDAKLPKEILDRHYKFVKHYEDNLAELKANLAGIEKLPTTNSELRTALQKAKLHLEKTKAPSRHQKLDPENLPFRARKAAKTRAPRLKKEDFEKDFPKQKTQSNKKLADSMPANEFFTTDGHGLARIFDSHSAISNPKSALNQRPVLLAFNEVASDVPFSVAVDSNTQSARSLPSNVSIGGNPQWDTPQIAFADSAPLLLAQAADVPTADDLSETVEVQFTDEIKAKAQELGYNPVKIYEYVRNNIEFVPTYGSIQGADMCLQTKQCNDLDTASLLIALLRASNIPARYVYGTVEVPIDKVTNWAGGFTDAQAALIFIASGGVPVAAGMSGSVITKARLEHVWVETNVAYGPYSGRPSNLNPDKIWVPLDPSYKQYTYTNGLDLQSAVPFDAQSFTNQILSTAETNTTVGSVTNVDSNYIQTTTANYQAQIQNYISQNMPNATVSDIIGKKEIKKQELGILPVTLPYKVVTVGTKYSEAPDNLRHKMTLEIIDSSASVASITYTDSIPEITGKRLTLSYVPATVVDQQVIDNYGGIFNAPAYLVNMAPQIKIEGVPVASGNSIGLGNQQIFNMTFVSPSGIADSVVSNYVTAGAYYGIGVNPSKIAYDLINKRRAKLEVVQSTVSDATIYTDDYIGELIYSTAMAYFYELDALTDIIAKRYKIADLKHVSEAIVSKDISVTTLYGIPATIADASMMIDVDRLVHSAVSQSGDQSKERQFTVMAGQLSSVMEHAIFEQLYQAKGVSAVQLLNEANNQGMPIYNINRNNIVSILPVLQISDDVRNDIQNAINAGENVVISQQNVSYYGWSGVGYIVMDQTGSGAYMISASLANGAYCVAAGGCSTQTFDGKGFAIAIGGAMGITAAIEVFATALEALEAVLLLGGWALLAAPFLIITMLVVAYFAYIMWTEFIKPNLQFSSNRCVKLAVGYQ